MLGTRLLDDSYPEEARRHVVALTVARLCGNACYRYAAPFLAVIARGLHVSLAQIGVAMAISEVAGLSSPLLGHVIDRVERRLAMTVGLVGVTVGTIVSATATGRIAFAIGLVVLAQSKVVFDLGMGSWIADHVEYARRGRIVGITETSWALGLLIGVSLLGVVTALASWRWAYVAGGAAVLVMAVVTRLRLAPDPGGATPLVVGDAATPAIEFADASPAPAASRATLARVVAAACALMAASQCVFVTFGSWLKDTFGYGAGALAAVSFLLGGGELCSSVTVARRADRWGKERSAAAGAAIMVPATLALAAWHGVAGLGLALLALALLGFEFGIVSALSIGSQLIPGSPAKGLGLLVGAGTAGRAAMSLVATRLYSSHGMGAPMVMSGALAAVSASAFALTRLPTATATRGSRS